MALSAREHHMFNIKSALAKQASTLVQDGYVIMLDASTTASHLVKELERFKDIIVITCGIKTAYMLSQTNFKHICTGGECINKSYSLIGQSAISTVRQYNADICFVSCHGLSPSGMATDTSVSENEVRYALMKQSRIKVLMMDNSKIDNGFWHNLCDISEFDCVICNTPLPEKNYGESQKIYAGINKSKYPPLKWGLWKALKGKVTGAALKRRTKLAYRTQASRALYSFLLILFLLLSIHCLKGS